MSRRLSKDRMAPTTPIDVQARPPVCLTGLCHSLGQCGERFIGGFKVDYLREKAKRLRASLL